MCARAIFGCAVCEIAAAAAAFLILPSHHTLPVSDFLHQQVKMVRAPFCPPSATFVYAVDVQDPRRLTPTASVRPHPPVSLLSRR